MRDESEEAKERFKLTAAVVKAAIGESSVFVQSVEYTYAGAEQVIKTIVVSVGGDATGRLALSGKVFNTVSDMKLNRSSDDDELLDVKTSLKDARDNSVEVIGLNVRAMMGTSVFDVAQEMVDFADRFCCPVGLDFNGDKLSAVPGQLAMTVVDNWESSRANRQGRETLQSETVNEVVPGSVEADTSVPGMTAVVVGNRAMFTKDGMVARSLLALKESLEAQVKKEESHQSSADKDIGRFMFDMTRAEENIAFINGRINDCESVSRGLAASISKAKDDIAEIDGMLAEVNP